MDIKERAKILLKTLKFQRYDNTKRMGGVDVYIHNDDFMKEGIEEIIFADIPDKEDFDAGFGNKDYKMGEPSLTAALAAPVLTKGQEQHLFRQMNYLKFKCNLLRNNVNPIHPTNESLDAFESCVNRIQTVRDWLVHCNTRLVASIVKKHADIDFDKFDTRFSDGVLSIFRAVDRFDYSKGNKFSTYATWAIYNNFGKTFKEEEMRETILDPEKVPEVPYNETGETVALDLENREIVDKLMMFLDRRTAKIVRSRMGLERELTQKQLGLRFKISKARIQQIEQSGIERLQMAARMLYPKFFQNKEESKFSFALSDK